MSELVAINGIVQARSQYMVSGDNIVFHIAPPCGSRICILSEDGRSDYEGTGDTYVYPGASNERTKYKQFMEDVYDKRYNPTVKDALEKLKVVMELVR
jgi:hypothetical protein